MERIETIMTPSDFFGEAIKGLLFAAIGWLVATFSFQRRLDDFEKRIVAPVRADVAEMKGAQASFATREELKSEIASLRGDVKEGIAEVKSLIRELRTDR